MASELPPPFIAVTDKKWFDFLSSRADRGRLDEVNFWSPKSSRPMKHMTLGEPVFFRLKAPINAIAGYGFFAHFAALDLEVAWQCFGWKNGDPDKVSFLRRIGDYRGVDLLRAGADRSPLGCTILRAVQVWPQQRWIPWGAEEGWARNIVQGKTEHDSARKLRLLSEMQASDQLIPDLDARPFVPLLEDERTFALREAAQREGQGAFRARLLDAYERACAITGEHTQPVLDAAHIQPYLGPSSNHVQNGLLLTKEFHTLFDLGYVTVTPDHIVRVSPALANDWHNGKRYYPYDGRRLVTMPKDRDLQPSRRSDLAQRARLPTTCGVERQRVSRWASTDASAGPSLARRGRDARSARGGARGGVRGRRAAAGPTRDRPRRAPPW